MMPTVGLTGGIGSGKSTVAGMFAALGVPVLDLDRVGREVMGPSSPAVEPLVRHFGKDILSADGNINRSLLAERAFASEASTKVLNAIVHPLIWQREAQWLAQQSAPYALIEASVLLESGGAGRMDAVVVVMADMVLRSRRVSDRGYPGAPLFDAIVARQCSDAERLAAADYVISNNGGLQGLQAQVEQLHRSLVSVFANAR